ncbi:DUF4157 domain-containing protein [Sphingomonas sp. KR3-1]|uniref:eCIS core domain-containing protein n=1 Tax=Sphingomonas sp. KR3-1 TaxID=3156611 RepID=UPI0032B3CB8E
MSARQASAVRSQTGRPGTVMRRSAPPPSRQASRVFASLSAVPSVQRKCAACGEAERHHPVQPRLEVGPAGDRYEREADSIAAQVMAMPGPASAAQGEATPASGAVQRACACSGSEEQVRAHREGGAESLAASDAELTTGGAPLPAGTRDYFEGRMGRDLSGVRVHQGSDASAMNASISARAFTYRNHVWLGARETAGPSFTMAHELAHVMQQTAPGPIGPQRRSLDATPSQAPTVMRKPKKKKKGGAAPPPGPTKAKSCALELCFAPIGVAGLGKAGFVHAKVNMTDSAGGKSHVEVQPGSDSGVADPASLSAGGRTTGTHSHVEHAGGHGTGSTCITIPATCAQVSAVNKAASEYEALDVVYNAPPGPNSNSFAEWILDRAGIGTSSISTPAGALGWGFYLSNPGDRAKPPRVARTAGSTKCSKPVKKAANFKELVALLRTAEKQMTACGVTAVGEQLNMLRGIFYGTPWSKDFETSQQSHVRNQMFNVYAGTTQPKYAMECLDCGTFLSIGASQDVTDPTGKVDVGHMLIGMDARRSFLARTAPQPVGAVPGVEASTWVGDLGGGAARLSVDRVKKPTASALTYFKGTDYGGPINLEGDVAGYAVGAGTVSSGSVPSLNIAPGKGVADAVSDYLIGAKGSAAGRNTRCTDFLTAMGGSFGASGLTNTAAVKTFVSKEIESFACWYMVNFMRQNGGINLKTAKEASHFIVGASQEIGSMFVDALVDCTKKPAATLAVKGPAPTPTPRASSGTCLMALGAAAISSPGQLLDDAKEKAGEFRKGIEDLVK